MYWPVIVAYIRSLTHFCLCEVSVLRCQHTGIACCPKLCRFGKTFSLNICNLYMYIFISYKHPRGAFWCSPFSECAELRNFNMQRLCLLQRLYLYSYEFPVTDPCRSPFRVHVPHPPEQPPLVTGQTPSYKESPVPAQWTNATAAGGAAATP